jgi:hypothetical protein
MRITRTPVLLRETRKTECGATGLSGRFVVRAAPFALLWMSIAAVVCGQTNDFSGSFVFPLDAEAIRYDTPAEDPVAKLQRDLESGKRKLVRDPKSGYLKPILEALGIPVSSQTLVFSKTSFQLHRISPDNPRALYFNDDVYVGYVPGGDVVELSAVDPRKGGVFYSLSQTAAEKPQIIRRDECLQCHASPRTLGVPGHIVRSVYPISEGYPATNAPSYNTDHRSPFEQRFGGWYLTGSTGNIRHMGNVLAADSDQPEKLDYKSNSNWKALDSRIDTDRFLTPHSDVVAHLVLSHQTAGHNYIARVSYEARTAMHMQAAINQSLHEPAGKLSESTERRLDRAAEILLRYLLMTDEQKLTSPVRGTSAFAEEFAKGGPRDAKGRSLREFDLATRTFKYPLSFLIYSEAFDQLPEVIRSRFYVKLGAVLRGEDRTGMSAALTAEQRAAIREIVLATKPEARRSWK